MNIKKFLVYIKLIGIGLVFLVILLFMLSNMQPVTINFLGRELWRVPMILFMLIMAGLGVAIYLIIRRIGKLIRDIRAFMPERKKTK